MTQQEPRLIFNSVSRDNNINAVRYYLAICILLNHFCVLSGADVIQLPRIFGGAGSFFAISGFLMFPSFEKRPGLKRYFSRRAKRIFPPYVFIVLLAAFGLVFVSNLPAGEYFCSKEFWSYLAANLSFLNFLSPDLPGVFTDATNSISAVNGSLWTMKGEVACYMTVPLVFYVVKVSGVRMARMLELLMVLFGAAYIMLGYMELNGNPQLDVISRQCRVMFLFYMGGYLNVHLSFIRRHWAILIAFCLAILMYDYVNRYWLHAVLPHAWHIVVLPLVTGLMVIACSVTGHWGRILSGHEALTYEIYLFHFPVIQLFVQFGVIESAGFFPSLLMVVAIVFAMAWLSQRCIEHNALLRR